MIESIIKNDVTLKRWRRFKSRKLAVISSWVLAVFCALSYSAEWWANSKPVLMKWHGEYYFPVMKDYSAHDFGQQSHSS